MRLTFVKEDGTYYAVAFDQIFNGEMCQEWMFAEISPSLGAFMVRWENDYSNPLHFNTLPEAKIYIEKNHYKYNPIPNGAKFNVENDE